MTMKTKVAIDDLRRLVYKYVHDYEIVDIMEGGEEAFDKRQLIYTSWKQVAQMIRLKNQVQTNKYIPSWA